MFDGVPQAEISRADIDEGLDMIAALSAKTEFLKSNGEARRALGENAISVNKEKVADNLLDLEIINEITPETWKNKLF